MHKVGLIGCGGQGAKHLAAYKREAGTFVRNPVIAVCDQDIETAAKLADYHNVGIVDDSIDELIEYADLTAYHIATPTPTHFDVFTQVAQDDPDFVFMEKPPAPDLHTAQRLVGMAHDEDIQLHFNFQRRFKKIFRRAYDAVEAFGGARTIKVGCWNVLDANIHYVDLANKFAGAGYRDTPGFDRCSFTVDESTRHEMYGVTDFEVADGAWRYDNGVYAHFDTDFEHRLEIETMEGPSVVASDDYWGVNGDLEQVDDEHYVDRAIRHVWSGGCELKAENALLAQEIIMACLASAQRGGEVVTHAPSQHPYETKSTPKSERQAEA